MKNDFLKRLRPASWRGVPFFVADEEGTFGREVVVHEFAQRDFPYNEDLGRKTRRFKINAWLCASTDNNFNPWPERDALLTAVETKGEGTLVHPHYGSMRGNIPTAVVKQASTVNGGLINIELEFIENGELELSATAIPDFFGNFQLSSSGIISTVIAEFASLFSLRGVAGYVLNDARTMISNLLRGFGAFSGSISAMQAIATLEALSVSGFYSELKTADTDDDSTIHTYFAKNVTDVISALPMPTDVMSIPLRQAIGYDDDNGTILAPVRNIATANRQQQLNNRKAFQCLVDVAAVTRRVELLAQLGNDRYDADSTVFLNVPKYVTKDELEATRAAVSDVVQELLLNMSDYEIYPETRAALVELRTDAIALLTENGEHLARTFIVNCCDETSWHGFVPSLVLAYRFYGELSDDVINVRNNIPNPLFVAPDSAVEMLDYGG